MGTLQYSQVRPAVAQSDLTTIAPYMFWLMFRNITSDGFVFEDPLNTGVLSQPGCVLASPSWETTAPNVSQDYVYNWTRDAAVTAIELAAGPLPTTQPLIDYVQFAQTCQNSASDIGHFDRASFLIRIAAWRPRPSGRGGNAGSPPRKGRWNPIVCSYVPVPAHPHARPRSGAAGPLHARPVRVEPRRRAALPLAPPPQQRAWLPGTVPAAHPPASPAPVAGRRLPDGAAAATARLHPRDDRLLRPGQPGRSAVVAQGRPRRGTPDRRARAAVGRAPAQPENRPGLGAHARAGEVPLVPEGTAGREVLPGDPGPRRALACRLRRDPRAGARTG